MSLLRPLLLDAGDLRGRDLVHTVSVAAGTSPGSLGSSLGRPVGPLGLVEPVSELLHHTDELVSLVVLGVLRAEGCVESWKAGGNGCSWSKMVTGTDWGEESAASCGVGGACLVQ